MLELLKQILTAFLVALTICPPSLVYAGGIQVDINAPSRNQAKVDGAPNGVPVINIVAPNSSGLSHNVFKEFNVGSKGLVINNSVSPGVSQLGGTLPSNENFNGNAASTILNEVSGNGRTSLQGYTEIFGQRANYILANPNGISINGGGFINTPKATLSTGVPKFNDNAFVGLDVTKGDILVEGAGINANNIDAFELVTRVAKINADIHAKQLNIVTGQNCYHPGTGAITPLTADGSAAPSVSIDSTALGGMYAGRISLVGTETGVGVNLEGLVQSAGDMELTADGRIQLKNKVAAQNRLAVISTASSIELTGETNPGSSVLGRLHADSAIIKAKKVIVSQSGGGEEPGVRANSIRVEADSVANSGSIVSDNKLVMVAEADGINNIATIQSGGTLSLQTAGSLNNSGQILSVKDQKIVASDVVNTAQGVIHSKKGTRLEAAGVIDNQGRISSGGALAVNARGGDLKNGGILKSGGNAIVQATGRVANAGSVQSEDELSVIANNLSNTGTLHSKGHSKYSIQSGLNNAGNSSELSSLGRLDVNVASGDIVNEGAVLSGEAATVRTGGTLRNSGKLLSVKSLTTNSGALTNSGTIDSKLAGMHESDGVVDNRGRLSSDAGLAVRSLTERIDNAGTLYSVGSGDIRSGKALNNTGKVIFGGNLNVASKFLLNTGVLDSKGNAVLSLQAGLSNSGVSSRLSADGDLEVEVSAGEMTNQGTIYVGQNGKIASSGKLTNAGKLQSEGSLNTSSSELENAGSIHSKGDGSHTSVAAVNNTGTGRISSDGKLAVSSTTGSVVNDGTVYSKSDGNISAATSITNRNKLLADGALTVAASTISNTGVIHSKGNAELSAAANLTNTNRISSDIDLKVKSSTGKVVNSGKIYAVGKGVLQARRQLSNTGRLSSGSGLTLNMESLTNTSALHSDGFLTLNIEKNLVNKGRISSGGNLGINALNLTNEDLIYSGGSGVFRIGNTLHNRRAVILSDGDMLFEGANAGQRMTLMRNDSGTMESLNGGLVFRANVFENNNLDFRLVEGATQLSYKEGGFWFYGDEWDNCIGLFKHYIGRSPEGGRVTNNAHRIHDYILAAVGLDVSRNIFSNEELKAAVATTEQKLAADPSYLDETEKKYLQDAKTLAALDRVYIGKIVGRTDGVVYAATTTRDQASGVEKGGHIAAQLDILVEGNSVKNNISKISAANGNITINANSFENVGKDIYERSTVVWGRGIFHNHQSPSVVPTGGGSEVVLTPVGYAYGSIEAGGRVSISADHVRNGISENNNAIVNPGENAPARLDPLGGVGSALNPIDSPSDIAVPDSVDWNFRVPNIDDLIVSMPQGSLYVENPDPDHPYLIETNPALTNVNQFFGSDYFLSRAGIDIKEINAQFLGDAFYETQLVRRQIQELSGRRFLDSAMTSDADQIMRLLDNAAQAKSALNLTIGMALTAEQVAALTDDIIWYEKRVVNGHEVLVPVVYLASRSVERLVQGGSVIVGNEVEINTTGDTANAGLIKSDGKLVITADNFFNDGGIVSGQDLTVAATDSIRNVGGTVQGADVALKAGKDVVLASKTVGFSGQNTSSTAIGKVGKVKATGNLTIEAGRDMGIVGSDVDAGGDTNLKAGGNVAVSTAETSLTSRNSGSGYTNRTDATDNRKSEVKTGGKLSVEAGKNVAVHGSRVEAGGDVTIKAGEDVSVTAATDKTDFYSHNSGSSGGFFGGKKSTTIDVKEQATVSSVIKSGESVNVEAGTAESGDLSLHGSRIKAEQDATLKAEGSIQVTPNQVENYHKQQEERSGFMGTSSMELDEGRRIANDRPQIEAGQKVALNAKEDVVLQSARIKSGDTTEITAQDGQVAMLVTKDSEYKRKVKSDMGFLTWSSSDKGNVDETVIHTIIDAGGGLRITTPQGVVVEFKESTGDVRKDAALLSNVEGLEWMGNLLERDDVDWQAVQETHDRWSKSDGGLAPGGMLIVSIIASAVTAGAASSLALATMGLEVAANGAIVSATTGLAASSTQLAMHAALAAAFTSIGTQVVTSVADAAAGGDLVSNLGNIVSTDGLRSLAASMIMAGTLNAGATTGSFAEMGKAGEYMATVTVQTVTDSIVGGEELQESFLSAVGSAFGRYSAGKIDASGLDAEMKIIMHGAAGAAGAAATGGDPYAGAMGAIVAELAAPMIDDVMFEGEWKDSGAGSTEGKTILAGSKIASVLAAQIAGLDTSDAAKAGGNAIMNNYLTPSEKEELAEKREICGDDRMCRAKEMLPFFFLSAKRDAKSVVSIAECALGDCSEHVDKRLELTAIGNELFKTDNSQFSLMPKEKSIYHTFKIDAGGKVVGVTTEANNNRKYIHPLGYEVVVDENGDIVKDHVNMGTYNWYNSNSDGQVWDSTVMHFLIDVVPYYFYGNSSSDTTTFQQRLNRNLLLLNDKWR